MAKKSDRQRGIRQRRCYCCCCPLESDERYVCRDCKGTLAQIAAAHHYDSRGRAPLPVAEARGRQLCSRRVR